MTNVYVNFLIVNSQLNHYVQRKKDPTQKKILIRLPFLGALSVQIRNKLKSFLHKRTDDKVHLTSMMLFQRLEKISASRANNHF